MLQGANSTSKAVAKTKLANIKSENARASLANITMLFPPDTTWRRGWSYVQHRHLALTILIPIMKLHVHHLFQVLGLLATIIYCHSTIMITSGGLVEIKDFLLI